jgi:hypothetical protein
LINFLVVRRGRFDRGWIYDAALRPFRLLNGGRNPKIKEWLTVGVLVARDMAARSASLTQLKVTAPYFW